MEGLTFVHFFLCVCVCGCVGCVFAVVCVFAVNINVNCINYVYLLSFSLINY